MTMPSSGDPVQLTIELQPSYSRGLAFLGIFFFLGRFIALIPIFIVLYLLGIAAGLVAWIMQFAVLFTGKYPEGAHSFVTGFLRWNVRATAWAYGLSDKYPTSMQP